MVFNHAVTHSKAGVILTYVQDFWSCATREKILSKPENPASTARPSLYVFALHLFPAAAVVVIATFNVAGYWVGKELSGPYNSNGPKELALQLTAKTHELLMLASLSENLMTHLLVRLVNHDGLPLGSLGSSIGFKSMSYLWSDEFRAMCTTRYWSRSFIVPLLLLCTMLGATVGPSSATALIPRLDEWPAGDASMVLNTSTGNIWPSRLAGDVDAADCGPPGLGCSNPMVWDSIGANLFSYWGKTALDGGMATPQHVSVPGILSVRDMAVRLKGSLNPVILDFSVATVQHTVFADLVNTFRFLTFPSRSTKCKTTLSPAMCSYLDVAWSVNAMQPVVFASCQETILNGSSYFPVIDHGNNGLAKVPVPVDWAPEAMDTSQFHWIALNDSNSLKSSIAAIIQPGLSSSSSQNIPFACSIQAQWGDSTTASRFSNTDYIVDGTPDGFQTPVLVTPNYRGTTVTIDPDWAQKAVQTLFRPGSNQTAFDTFINLGSTENISTKLEATIAVLFAEAMAHTSAGTIPLSIESKDLALKTYGNLTNNETISAVAQSTKFNMKTTMIGYGYGLYTTDGLSISCLLSLIILAAYLTLTVAHVVSLCVSDGPYIQAWHHTKDIFALFLNTQSDFKRQVTDGKCLSDTTLQIKVVICESADQAELVPSGWMAVEASGRDRSMARRRRVPADQD